MNEISLYNSSKQLFDMVVKPFVLGKHVEPEISIQVLEPNPLWVAELDTLVIQARVTVPLGMYYRYTLRELNWYTGSLGANKWVVRAKNKRVVSSEGRYGISAGLHWRERKSLGFFVLIFDISLVVGDFHCGLLDSVHATVDVYDVRKDVVVVLRKGLDVNCMWKPRLHPACNCTHALLHYNNPDGLCSPTCIETPFAHLSEGAHGSENDWTLEITHKDPEPSIAGHGRVLFGTVPYNTQRFCLVTVDIFTRSPGPKRYAPSAPLDVIRCDIVLLEFDIWLEDPPAEHYLPVAVRSLSTESNMTPRQVHIPLAAEDTLRTIIRQGWGDKIGVKLSFLHSSRAAPYQEELAAILDWILTIQSQQNRAPRVVVVDMDLGTLKSDDFAMLHNLYGSTLELIPGLSADTLADVIRTTGYKTEYNHWKCSNRENCSRLTAIYDKEDNLLYEQASNDTIPDCREALPYSVLCVVCKAEYVIIICPNGIHPADVKDSAGGVLAFEQYTLHQMRNPTRPNPLSPEQERAEAVLREVGLLVSAHGAFLNLDTVSVFPQSKTGCERVKPGRWTVGDYSPEDPYAIRIPRDEQYPERTGLLVFEELCKRSNNRAGIVVSVPSADYISDAGCKRVRLHNRHIKTRHPEGSDVNTAHYSMSDLVGIILDMAKWGTPPSGAGGYSYAHVDGLYKLEGGMFFQRVTSETPLVKSFVRVPGIPNLRLGLSSAMNVGSLLPGDEHLFQDAIEKVKFIPYGAQVVSLGYKDMEAFVDRDRICIRAPATTVRSDGLRKRDLRSFTSGLSHWLGAPVLTRHEEEWLNCKAGVTSRWLRSALGSMASVLDVMHLISKTVECIRGSSSCMELGDYADNNWPQGGTGYPIAISVVEALDDEVSIKIIIRVNHGATRVKTSCDLKPFSFGSTQPSSPQTAPGFYMHTEEPLRLRVKRYVTDVGPRALWITQALTLLYCPDANQSLPNRIPTSEDDFQRANDCVSMRNKSLMALSVLFAQLGSLIQGNVKTEALAVKHAAYISARTSTLCLSATVLAVLINITTIVLFCGLGLIGNGSVWLDSQDHRVILHPGRWKIRSSEDRGSYVAYHIFLGFNWTELMVNYPECSQVACRGLPDSWQGCDHLCNSGTWRDATVTLSTATLEYNRAMSSLDATFNDLAALMDMSIVNQHWTVYDPVSKLLSYNEEISLSDPQLVDVMRFHRRLIDEALTNVVDNFPGTLSYTPANPAALVYNHPVSGYDDTGKFNELMDTWKSGAFKLAVQLNAVTFAIQELTGTYSCAQGVQRSDVTGCEPGFVAEFYTDTPVASRSLSSSRLVMVVKRETWNPILLSRWYMPF
ncbi:hypothetical protein DPEC_G00363930 [Dallia pectoralis]|nr:hypothetical protein DPEC_G00363930 [Dallia pectoralis]